MAVNYVLVFSDPADADLERMTLSLNRRDPDYAARWEAGLSQALQDLLGFPGPLSHARDEEASGHYSREVRRMLYYGPTRRRSGTPIRAFCLHELPPAPDDPPKNAETVIFLLRLLQETQSLASDTLPGAEADWFF